MRQPDRGLPPQPATQSPTYASIASSLVPNSFNGPNPINNGVIVNAATGTLYFSGSNGASVTAIPGGTYFYRVGVQ